VGVAIGVTLVVGTLMPPLLHGQGAVLFTTKSGLLTMAGVLVALDGRGHCLLCRTPKRNATVREVREFNLKLGLLLAILCGVFSSGMSFAIDAAEPMETSGTLSGREPALCGALPSYVFIMGGGAIVNMSYCFIRLAALKRLSLRSDLSYPAATLLKNAGLAAMGGIMWYLQFFFYAWGRGQHS
jgi:L-rhamnose-H+ transport protein